MTNATLTAADIATKVIDLLSERQAEDIVQLDIREVADFTDYFVIASAQNVRHMSALVDAINKDLANAGVKALHIEGESDSGWILIDFGDVITHLFTPEDRTFYKLEQLWARAGVPAVRFQ